MMISREDVERVLNQALPGVEVVSVDLSDDVNRDDLRVTYVTARYRAGRGEPRVDEVLRASEALVNLMPEDAGYPILRLMSADDAPALAAE